VHGTVEDTGVSPVTLGGFPVIGSLISAFKELFLWFKEQLTVSAWKRGSEGKGRGKGEGGSNDPIIVCTYE
jgi:hypothetical protein